MKVRDMREDKRVGDHSHQTMEGVGMKAVKFIEVCAEPRYWEDAEVDGVEDFDGSLIPLRRGNAWCPVIDLTTGQVQDWPEDITAKVYYKVCDEGEYWLLDENRKRIAKYADYYVPDRFLCHGDQGFGDYIILNINEHGMIEGWTIPAIDHGMWNEIEENDERK